MEDPLGSDKHFGAETHGPPKLIDWLAGTIMPCCVRGYAASYSVVPYYQVSAPPPQLARPGCHVRLAAAPIVSTAKVTEATAGGDDTFTARMCLGADGKASEQTVNTCHASKPTTRRLQVAIIRDAGMFGPFRGPPRT